MAGPVLLTMVLLPVRDRVGIDTVLLLLMLVSVVASALGGVVSAVLATAVAAGLANFFFTKPYGSLQVASTSELIDLVIFFAVAVLVGVITEWGARARARAEGARLRAEWLAALGTRGDDADAVEVALAEARTRFSMNRVALLRADGAVLAQVGAAQATTWCSTPTPATACGWR